MATPETDFDLWWEETYGHLTLGEFVAVLKEEDERCDWQAQ